MNRVLACLRKYGLSTVLALICTVLLVVSLALKGSADNANHIAGKATVALQQSRTTNERLANDERLLCHRLNVHRVEQDDANWYREWLFDKYFLFALVHPLRGMPRPHGEQRKELKSFERYLKRIVSSMTWTPATKSCLRSGVGSPPVRFSVRQPSSQDLTLRAGP